MNINECHLGNLPAMLRRPISFTSSPLWGRRESNLTITVAHRLAHLIFRMETQRTRSTVIGVKWYLDNIPLVQAEGAIMTVIMPFVDRLTQMINDYEQNFGPIDTREFAVLVELSGIPAQRVLFGPEIFFQTGPCFGEPLRNLSRWISYSLWAQTINET